MAVNLQIKKGDKENNMSVLRRFRQHVQGWGGLRKIREDLRFYSRKQSEYVKKKNRLRAIETKGERAKLYKLGQVDSR